MSTLEPEDERSRGVDAAGGVARAVRSTAAGVLVAATAFAAVRAAEPDLAAAIVPPNVPLGGTIAAAIGLSGIAAATLVAASARLAGFKSTRFSGGIAPEPFQRAGPGARTASPMRVGLDELVEAVAIARISRVLVLGPGRAQVVRAVTLARRLAGCGDPTILVDFDGMRIANDVGLIGDPAESVADIVARPETFARSIHRDRSSGAHAMMVRLGALDTVAGASGVSAATAVLATLEEVYARVVVILPGDAAAIGALVHGDTAFVASNATGNVATLRATFDSLSTHDIGDVVLLDDEATSRDRAAA